MKNRAPFFWSIVIAALLLLAQDFRPASVTGAQSAAPPNAEARQKREQLYRFNNLGVALMEQYKHEEAAKQFKQALASDPNFAVAHVNLALTHYFLNDSRSAVEEAKTAVKLAPKSLSAHYVLGIALRNEKLYDEAVAEFNQVLAIDAKDPATNIQLGQIYLQGQQYQQAIPAFRRALEAEPYNATAAYSLAQSLNRSGNMPEGRKMLERFQQLRASGYATTLGNVYGEKGRYAEAVLSTGAEPELIPADPAKVVFVEAPAGIEARTKTPPVSAALGRKILKSEFNDQTRRELVMPFSSTVGLADLNNDDQLDLVVSGVDGSGQPFVKLGQNSGGKFSDVTDKSKLTAGNFVAGAIGGDFDNDGRTDLALFGYHTLALWRNNGDGSFTDVTAKAGLPEKYNSWALTAAWVDLDHDGDLDLFIGNFADLSQWPVAGDSATFPDDFPGEENRVYRNNGNGTFTEITGPSGLGGGKHRTTAVVCTDFNNQRDIDLFIVNYGGPAQLFSNQRDGSFKEIAAQVGINSSGRTLGVGAGDLNKDNFVDFYLPRLDGQDLLFLSDGRGGFEKREVAGEGAGLAAQFADYDDDGLLDVVTQNGAGVQLRRGLAEKLADPAKAAAETKFAAARALAVGDLDRDGGIDFISINHDGAVVAFKSTFPSEGAGKNFARLSLAGKTSNRSAIGTKVEMRSGSLRQKLEIYASSPAPAAMGLTFGLGYRTGVDALQIYWPAGILQSELAVKAAAENTIEELDRKGTSCPLLYAWNGREYGFVTDFLGGSAIGYLEAPGRYNYPDTDEYLRLTNDQLKERDGVLSLRMNNQLEEVIYFDRVKLLAVDHPAGTEIYPNERLMPEPPYPQFKLYQVKAPRPPLAATDDQGRDIRPLITEIDRRYPEEFEKLPFKGYAREHAITLNLGHIKTAKQVLLLMTAWIDYADSTSNLAASQAGAQLIPPYVQVKNARGEWETVIPQMGFPAGLPKTMTVDLTGKFLSDDPRVRIVTSMRIYWDQILVEASGEKAPAGPPLKITTLEPLRADLRWRGFPREYSPDGRLPMIYDYQVIEPSAPWKTHLGNYTRYGDVRALLAATDDMYVITRNGDEIQIDFNARRLPALRPGRQRTFLVYADGFGKDMDLNSARPETIGELPFHRMKSYPYSPTDSYPKTLKHREYLRLYNTRTVNDQNPPGPF
ncbi:MAG TPA: FG-GAP-like repeat-containing protein [Blastocatellia bacterium]|nr:FG-GAP-like repeat-containing protein [Blastocatellia bacterium]